jgi:D-alanyl-D-alanine carboxypeptidase
MPYPAFRMAELNRQPQDAKAEVVQIATIQPDPDAVARQLKDPVLTGSIEGPIPAQKPVDIGLEPAVQAANMVGGATALAPQQGNVDVIGAWLSETFSLGAAPAPLGQTRPSAPLVPPVGIGDEGQPVDLMTSGSVSVQAEAVTEQPAPAPLVAMAQTAAPQPEGGVVQIGAAPSEQGANSLLSSASGSIADLGAFKPYVERFEKNGHVFFRARFAGFGGRDDAAAMCNQLKKVEMSCLAMQS